MHTKFSKKNSSWPGLPLARISQLAQRLPPPSKYDPGLPLPVVELPASIKIFSRTSHDFTRAKPNVNLAAYVLIVNLRGPAFVIIDNFPIRFRPAETLLIFPHQYHHYSRLQERNPFWIFIAFQTNNDHVLLNLKYRPIPLAISRWDCLEHLLRGYTSARRLDSTTSGQIALNLWLFLLDLESRFKAGARRQTTVHTSLPYQSQVMLKAQNFIMDHLTEPLRVADVARQANLSPTYLQQLFKQHLGMGIGKYIRRRRVNYASHLINFSEGTLKQIAEHCGFSSLYVFSRTFKQDTGYAPAAYRNLLQRLHFRRSHN